MGKFKQGVSDAALMTGNTIATPLRRGGETANALWNVLSRQPLSSVKNTYEVQLQSLNTTVDNFLNFSKVEGPRYKRMVKVPINFVSAVTRRPFMIAGAEIASTLNQGVRQPFKKVLYTPGKRFKGMLNATRIFSKKKGFDFATYDTHETTGDTRVNKIREKRIGFFGKGSSSEKTAEKPKDAEKKESKTSAAASKSESKPEAKPLEVKKPEEKKTEEKKPAEKPKDTEKPEPKKPDQPSDKKSDAPAPTPSKPTTDTPKSIDEIEKKNKEEAKAKDKAEQEKNFPDRKTLTKEDRVKYKKDIDKTLKNNLTKEGIIARGKEAKVGETVDQILATVKKEYPTMAGYFEEILSKEQPAKAA